MDRCQKLAATWSSEATLGACELTCGPEAAAPAADVCLLNSHLHKVQIPEVSPVSLEMTCAASAFSAAEIMGLGRRCTLRMSSRP